MTKFLENWDSSWRILCMTKSVRDECLKQALIAWIYTHPPPALLFAIKIIHSFFLFTSEGKIRKPQWRFWHMFQNESSLWFSSAVFILWNIVAVFAVVGWWMVPYESSFHVCLHVLQLIYSSHLLLIIADQSNVKKL